MASAAPVASFHQMPRCCLKLSCWGSTASKTPPSVHQAGDIGDSFDNRVGGHEVPAHGSMFGIHELALAHVLRMVGGIYAPNSPPAAVHLNLVLGRQVGRGAVVLCLFVVPYHPDHHVGAHFFRDGGIQVKN